MPLFNDLFPPHVIAFTGDRSVDFSLHNGQKTFNQQQLDYLSSSLKVDLPEPVRIRQVHGDTIIVTDGDAGGLPPEADGLLTRRVRLPLAIRTADCVPVFLYDAQQDGIGLVHAGWRGAQKNILKSAVTLMRRQWQAEPNNIMAVLGPAIRSCCYEVGGEFRGYFPKEVSVRDGKYFLDLPRVLLNQLAALGVPDEHIHDCGICTCCEERCFSYRREGAAAGRMISIIALKPKGGG
jgi:YfiH family protein